MSIKQKLPEQHELEYNPEISRSGRQKVAQVEDECCLNRTRADMAAKYWIHLKKQGLAKGDRLAKACARACC